MYNGDLNSGVLEMCVSYLKDWWFNSMDALFNSFIEPTSLFRENTEQDPVSLDNGRTVKNVDTDSKTPAKITVEKLFEMTIPILQKIQDIEAQITYYQPSRRVVSVQHQKPTGFANIRVLRSLDELCMPVFRHSLNPEPSDLYGMTKEVSKMYPKLARKQILSILRKWFRKRRDENGQKVFAACLEVLVPLMNQGLSISHVREDMQAQGPIMRSIRSKSNLEIADEVQINNFVVKKIEAFLDRRIDKDGNYVKHQ
jgi:hypothetical protein